MLPEAINPDDLAEFNTVVTINDKEVPYHKALTIDNIIALKTNHPNLTQDQAAQLLNCSNSAIRYHLYKHNVKWEQVAKDIKLFNNAEIDLLSFKAAQALKHLTPEKLEKESAVQNSTVYCQLFDKRQLLLGRATAMIGIEALQEHRISLEDASKQALERKAALEAKIAALESANPTVASDTSTDE